MTYKEYSLEHLEEWVHDALNCENVTPQEIYDTIVKCVDENIEYHKKYLTKNIDLLSLLKGQWDYTATGEKFPATTERDWSDFWEESLVDDEPQKRTWTLPVEQVHDEYFLSFPPDLLEAAHLKEGDTIEWIDRKDGSYEMRKMDPRDARCPVCDTLACVDHLTDE